MSDNKDFSQKLHDKHDPIGRATIKKWLSNIKKVEWKAVDNPNKYGIDLILYRNNKMMGYAEVAHRPAWKGVHFTFPNLNVEFRKKWMNVKENVLYFAVNKECTAMYFCNANKILSSRTDRNDTVHKKNEKFYKVDLDLLQYRRFDESNTIPEQTSGEHFSTKSN